MLLVKWNKDYSVGIDEFDKQHMKMFDIINRFYDEMQNEQGKEYLKTVLKELIDYAEYHLKYEEDLFEKYGYPDKEGHKKIHDDYRNKINDFVNNSNDSLISFDIIDFLEDWWLGHISQKDKEYTDFFHEKGIK